MHIIKSMFSIFMLGLIMIGATAIVEEEMIQRNAYEECVLKHVKGEMENLHEFCTAISKL